MELQRIPFMYQSTFIDFGGFGGGGVKRWEERGEGNVSEGRKTVVDACGKKFDERVGCKRRIVPSAWSLSGHMPRTRGNCRRKAYYGRREGGGGNSGDEGDGSDGDGDVTGSDCSSEGDEERLPTRIRIRIRGPRPPAGHEAYSQRASVGVHGIDMRTTEHIESSKNNQSEDENDVVVTAVVVKDKSHVQGEANGSQNEMGDQATAGIATSLRSQVPDALSTSYERCSICLEDITSLAPVIDSCSHHFHRHCIEQWVQTENSCPNCKKRVTKITVRSDDGGASGTLVINVEDRRQRMANDNQSALAAAAAAAQFSPIRLGGDSDSDADEEQRRSSMRRVPRIPVPLPVTSETGGGSPPLLGALSATSSSGAINSSPTLSSSGRSTSMAGSSTATFASRSRPRPRPRPRPFPSHSSPSTSADLTDPFFWESPSCGSSGSGGVSSTDPFGVSSSTSLSSALEPSQQRRTSRNLKRPGIASVVASSSSAAATNASSRSPRPSPSVGTPPSSAGRSRGVGVGRQGECDGLRNGGVIETGGSSNESSGSTADGDRDGRGDMTASTADGGRGDRGDMTASSQRPSTSSLKLAERSRTDVGRRRVGESLTVRTSTSLPSPSSTTTCSGPTRRRDFSLLSSQSTTTVGSSSLSAARAAASTARRPHSKSPTGVGLTLQRSPVLEDSTRQSHTLARSTAPVTPVSSSSLPSRSLATPLPRSEALAKRYEAASSRGTTISKRRVGGNESEVLNFVRRKRPKASVADDTKHTECKLPGGSNSKNSGSTGSSGSIGHDGSATSASKRSGSGDGGDSIGSESSSSSRRSSSSGGNGGGVMTQRGNLPITSAISRRQVAAGARQHRVPVSDLLGGGIRSMEETVQRQTQEVHRTPSQERVDGSREAVRPAMGPRSNRTLQPLSRRQSHTSGGMATVRRREGSAERVATSCIPTTRKDKNVDAVHMTAVGASPNGVRIPLPSKVSHANRKIAPHLTRIVRLQTARRTSRETTKTHLSPGQQQYADPKTAATRPTHLMQCLLSRPRRLSPIPFASLSPATHSSSNNSALSRGDDDCRLGRQHGGNGYSASSNAHLHRIGNHIPPEIGRSSQGGSNATPDTRNKDQDTNWGDLSSTLKGGRSSSGARHWKRMLSSKSISSSLRTDPHSAPGIRTNFPGSGNGTSSSTPVFTDHGRPVAILASAADSTVVSGDAS